MLRRALAPVLAAWLLAACSGVTVIESVVTAFAAWPAPALVAPAGSVAAPGMAPAPGTPLVVTPLKAPWRFERLPSQQRPDPRQAAFEGMVQAQLERLGWPRDEAAARYQVQVLARSRREAPPLYRSPWVGTWRQPFGTRPFGPPMEPLLIEREFVVLIRDLASNQVVFESHAVQENTWTDGMAVWNALATAALHEFPHPPAGPRRIGIQIPS